MLLGLLRPADPGVRPAQSSIYISTCADVSELCMPSLGRRALTSTWCIQGNKVVNVLDMSSGGETGGYPNFQTVLFGFLSPEKKPLIAASSIGR